MPLNRPFALLTLVLAAALAAPAQAGVGGKPVVDEFSRCDEIGPDAVLCVQSRTVTKTTQTPSGLVHVRTRTTITGQFTSPDCDQQEYQERSERSFTKGLKDQVLTTKDRLRIVGTCFDPDGVATDCVQTLKFHLANGTVRVDRFDFTCQPAG